MSTGDGELPEWSPCISIISTNNSQVAAVRGVSAVEAARVHGESLDEGGELPVGVDILEGGAVVEVVEASRRGLAVALVVPGLAQASAVAALLALRVVWSDLVLARVIAVGFDLEIIRLGICRLPVVTLVKEGGWGDVSVAARLLPGCIRLAAAVRHRNDAVEAGRYPT